VSGPDALLLLLTCACFIALVLAARLPVSLSLAATSLVLTVAAGRGFPLAHLVEGMFSYLDVVLVLITAMIFMKVIEANGLLAELTQGTIVVLGHSPLLLLTALTLVIMFPGMITGSCSASVLGTGAILLAYVTTWYAALRLAPATAVTCVLTVGAPITAALNAIAGRPAPTSEQLVGYAVLLGAVLIFAAASFWRTGEHREPLPSAAGGP